MIAENQKAELWTESIVPTDPVELAVPDVSLPDALKTAMENRPELQQSNVLREINQIDQRYFKDQTKPAIDLVGTYGVSGLAGAISSAGVNPFTASSLQVRQRVDELSELAGLEPLPIVPPQTFSPELLGGFGQSLTNLLANRYSNFKVGVQISLPLRNRTAEAHLGRTLVEGERIGTQREQLEQTIQVDVRNALQAMRSAQSRLRAATATREANEQQFASEQRKLDAGQSTVFLVLERQTNFDGGAGAGVESANRSEQGDCGFTTSDGQCVESQQYRGASALTGFPVLLHLITAAVGFRGETHRLHTLLTTKTPRHKNFSISVFVPYVVNGERR